jgi:transcription elongation factor Elf1
MNENKEEQKCPCPVCGHEQSSVAYYEEVKRKKGVDASVPCEMCGAEIRVQVPFHVLCALPHGWRWVRAYREREPAINHAVVCLHKVIESGAVGGDKEDPIRGLFLALNALTLAEVEKFFQHTIIKQEFEELERTYASYRALSTLVKDG